MSDSGTSATLKEKMDKMDSHPFTTFSKPYLDFLAKGKIFGFIYLIMAVVNLIIPFAVIYKTIDSGIFSYTGAKFTFAIILSWLVIGFACWIGFQIWWNRRAKAANDTSYEFITTTRFAEIWETFGEWLGTFIGIIGAGVGLIAMIFLGDEASYLFSSIGMDSLNFGPMVILIGPVTGLFIIIISRFLAEQLRLFASLVNNTKDIAKNLKK